MTGAGLRIREGTDNSRSDHDGEEANGVRRSEQNGQKEIASGRGMGQIIVPVDLRGDFRSHEF